MQSLLDRRPGFEGRDQQIEFAIAIQVVARSIPTVLFHRDAHEITNFEKRFSGLIEKETILFETAVGSAGPVMFAGKLEERSSQNRIVLRGAGVNIMPPKQALV